MKTIINTNNAPAAIGLYSQAVRINNLVYTAGQIPMTMEGNILEGTIEEQTHQVMNNLKAVLSAAGVSFENVVNTTMYITDFDNFMAINGVYSSYFDSDFPARETVGVKSLPKGVSLEISMIAIK